jgi:hypothetical protein
VRYFGLAGFTPFGADHDLEEELATGANSLPETVCQLLFE